MIKKQLLTGFFFILFSSVFSQENKDFTENSNKISVHAKYASSNPELRDLLLSQNIDYHQVKFIGENLKGRNYIMVAKEISKGLITNIDTVFNSQTAGVLISDTLQVRVTGSYDKKKLKMAFFFPHAMVRRSYNSQESDFYSLREVASKMSPVISEEFYSFAYIQPYEKNGIMFYCAVDRSGKDIETWGKEFGIDHYLVFEMKIF